VQHAGSGQTPVSAIKSAAASVPVWVGRPAFRLTNGALDALKTWNGVLLDGHNCFDICTKHKLPFDVDEVGKDGWVRNDAEIWIIENQFHRRNLDALTRVELGLKLEERYAARAKENEKHAVGGDRRSLAFQGRENSTDLDTETNSAAPREPTLADLFGLPPRDRPKPGGPRALG
jgi:hypothetical protein